MGSFLQAMPVDAQVAMVDAQLAVLLLKTDAITAQAKSIMDVLTCGCTTEREQLMTMLDALEGQKQAAATMEAGLWTKRDELLFGPMDLIPPR